MSFHSNLTPKVHFKSLWNPQIFDFETWPEFQLTANFYIMIFSLGELFIKNKILNIILIQVKHHWLHHKLYSIILLQFCSPFRCSESMCWIWICMRYTVPVSMFPIYSILSCKLLSKIISMHKLNRKWPRFTLFCHFRILEFKPVKFVFFILSKSNHHQIKLANIILLSYSNDLHIFSYSPWFLKNWAEYLIFSLANMSYLVAGDNISLPRVHVRNDHEKIDVDMIRNYRNGLLGHHGHHDVRRSLD